MFKKLQPLLWTIPFLGFILGYALPSYFLLQTAYKTPSVVGKPLQEALSILSKHQLHARLFKEVEDKILPTGTVIQQIPQAQHPIKAEQTVTLTVSKKPIPALTPECIGKNQEEITRLTKKTTALIEHISIPSTRKGPACIAQTPASDTPLLSKAIVTYFSQQSERLCIMPNLVGEELLEVHTYLSSIPVSFQVFWEGVPLSDPALFNDLSIISQRPLPGSIINLAKPPCIQFEVA